MGRKRGTRSRSRRSTRTRILRGQSGRDAQLIQSARCGVRLLASTEQTPTRAVDIGYHDAHDIYMLDSMKLRANGSIPAPLPPFRIVAHTRVQKARKAEACPRVRTPHIT